MSRNSSVSTSLTATTTDTDNESPMLATNSLDIDYNLKLRQLLQLDDSHDSQRIAETLMERGRQALRDRGDELPFDSNVFEKHMSRSPNELLSILKQYNELLLEKDVHEEWFHRFLLKLRGQFHVEYDSILTQLAECGCFRFNKINAVLSLIVQFFFKFGADSDADNLLLNQVFDSMLNEGYESIQTYKDHLRDDLLKIQIENDQNALYLALRDYFRSSLLDLFKQAQIDANETEALETVLNCVMKAGWWKGVREEQVKQITSININAFIKKLKDYCTEKKIPIPTEFAMANNEEVEQAPEPEPNDEHQVVLMCTKEAKKQNLSDLVTAGELTYINQVFTQIIDTIVKAYASNKRFLSFIRSCFTPIMYLLKRCQNLDDFFKGLHREYSKCKLTVRKPKLSLRMLIHIILSNSDLSLSRKLMFLLSKRNPVPLLQLSSSNHQNDYVFVSSITHVWDYSKPTLLSFGIGPCKGKSTILNRIFLSSFERSMNSIYFQNTIDIDFGSSFLKPRLANIADVHGSIEKALLERIHELFDGFLIHIQYEYFQNNRDSCVDILNIVQNIQKYCLLIIRDCPIDDDDDDDDDDDSGVNLLPEITDYKKVFLRNVSDQSNQKNEDSIKTLNDIIWNDLAANPPRVSPSIETVLEDLMDETYKQETHEVLRAISPLEHELIKIADGKVAVEAYFPEYLIFVKLCELKLQLANFNFYAHQIDEDVDKVRREILQKEHELQNAKTHPNRIHQLFCDMLNAPNTLVPLDLLIAKLKQARTKYVSQADMASNISLEKKLSIDILWRNTILCSEYETNEVQQHLRTQYSEYIKAGFPFEIIDGDNLYFQYSFLYGALQTFRSYRTLVISIIGPQNSGKSTLLNYMFGTLFDVRDGRCTRGVYGSLVKTNRTDFEYIMLIDTEGLLGIEGRNIEYDRRIVLFCLAVSHVVILNMRGEISKPIETILTLCAESLNKMGITHMPAPTVHFVLNQQADPNIE
ncbi:unnamed protein product, partial [Adineta ricciae]